MEQFRAEIQRVAEELANAEPDSQVLVAEPLPSRPWIRIARSQRGFAAVLPEVAGPSQPDIEFANLRVQFNAPCSVRVRGETRTERLVLIECTSTDQRLQECFLDVLAIALPDVLGLSGAEYGALITSLADLFASIQKAGRTSVLGLWGELFVLSKASSRDIAGSAWHASPSDTFDFALSGSRIEVKTATSRRAHYFSLEQVRPLYDVQVIVASLLTMPSIGGPSVEELLDEACRDLDRDLQARIRSVAMRSLGDAWQVDSATRFDSEMAGATLEWFDSASIPAVENPRIEVSEVRFKSDLTECAPLSPAQVRERGPLPQSIIGSQ